MEDRNIDRKIFHPLVYFLNGHSDHGRARPKAGYDHRGSHFCRWQLNAQCHNTSPIVELPEVPSSVISTNGRGIDVR